jgi:hypothetical protein
MVRKFSPRLGFDPQTIQSVTSNNTDYTILAAIAIAFSITMGTPKEEIIRVGVHLGFTVSELT